MFIPAWAILVGAFVLIAIWAAVTMAGSLESMASVSTAPSLEAAAGRAAIRGTIFTLGVVLVAVAILAAFYAYYRRPAVPLLQDATVILTTPVPVPCGVAGGTPTASCNLTPEPTAPPPSATPSPPSPTGTPHSEYGLAVGQNVVVVVDRLDLVRSNPDIPASDPECLVLQRGDPAVITHGPFLIEGRVHWNFNGGGCSQGLGPEKVNGQAAVLTMTPTPAPSPTP